MSWLTKPARPKIRMRPSPMTKGGVMMGSTVSKRSTRLALNPVRVATRAKASPSPVVVVAVRSARGRRCEEAGGARRPPGTPKARRGQPGRDEGAHQHEARHEQPGPSELHRLQDGGGEVALGQHPGGPAQAEETVRERVPRQHEKAQDPEDAPDQRAPAQTSAHGPVATSAGY